MFDTILIIHPPPLLFTELSDNKLCHSSYPTIKKLIVATLQKFNFIFLVNFFAINVSGLVKHFFVSSAFFNDSRFCCILFLQHADELSVSQLALCMVIFAILQLLVNTNLLVMGSRCIHNILWQGFFVKGVSSTHIIVGAEYFFHSPIHKYPRYLGISSLLFPT